MNPATLSLFILTFAMVSLTPGMCMTLSLSLGLTIGVRRTLWMMVGELVGVGLVAGAAGLGAAAVMLNTPALFLLLKLGGGAYLGWLGVQLWCSKGRLAIDPNLAATPHMSRLQLATQGFTTAVANPKGWAFFVALLPPFIDQSRPVAPQLVLLLGMILVIEFASLLLYATSGRMLGRGLLAGGRVRLINRLAGVLMAGVGLWLALE
ncbi:MAG: LysE family translocator [Geothermobacteraceae bacterium]